MIRTVKNSRADKTEGLAITYRAGKESRFGTCPTNCGLNPNKKASTEKIDIDYLKAVLDAVPKFGSSFTYTHFNLDDIDSELLEQIKTDKKKTVFNISVDSIEDAVETFKKGYDVAVTLPYTDKPKKSFKKDGINFVRCINEYDKRYNCLNCQWCNTKKRKFVVVFHAHGCKKKEFLCYADNYYTRMVWEGTRNLSVGKANNTIQNKKTDGEILKEFTKELYFKKIRHHIAGDIGKD